MEPEVPVQVTRIVGVQSLRKRIEVREKFHGSQEPASQLTIFIIILLGSPITHTVFFKNGPYPASFSLFSSFQYTVIWGNFKSVTTLES